MMTKGLTHPANPTTVARGPAPTMLVQKEGRRPAGFYAPQHRKTLEAVTQLSPRGTGIAAFRQALEKAGSPRTASPFHKLKSLRRLTMVCAWCNKILDSEGLWQRAETGLQADRQTEVSHGICPGCAEKSYNAYRMATPGAAPCFSTSAARSSSNLGSNPPSAGAGKNPSISLACRMKN